MKCLGKLIALLWHLSIRKILTCLIYRDSLTPTRAWPSLEEMKSFRQRIRTVVDDLILNKMPLEDNTEINFSHPFWTILMGIEHEKIHLETTSCLIR
jgi:hypothetical protein